MRFRLPHVALLAGALAVLAPALARADAPEGGYWWFTPMAGWQQFSNKLFYPSDSLDDQVVYGARLGRAFNGMWGLEAGGAYSMPKEAINLKRQVNYYNVSGSLMFTPAQWKLGAFYLAAGGGYSQYKADNFTDIHFGTFEQAVGWRSWFGPHVGLRLEARNILAVPKKNLSSANLSDQQYWGGLEFAWGGRPRDSDGDGVPDKHDKCPNTPRGAIVDANGCPLDSDGDGVYDGLDKCTGTPKGAIVDATGCPHDSDGDGVYDGLDKCPGTPKGAIVDANGCPLDSDGDGVYDGLDKCPNTPKGAVVDSAGCPKDSDGDGVPDGLDKCPDTPAGARVDADGCPIVVTEKETELLDTGMIRLQNVNFETGKADLLPEAYPALDEVGAILLKWPQLKIEVGGHTDSRGTKVRNQALSEARAAAVRDYLLKKFPNLVADQLTSKGYGASKPIAPNTTALNRAKNRRVEFVVLNKDVLRKEVEKRKTLQK